MPEDTNILELGGSNGPEWKLIKKDKITYYFCMMPIQDTDLGLGIFCPADIIMKDYHNAENMIISVALLVFAISFILCFLLSMIPMKNMMDQNRNLKAQNDDNSRKLAEEYIEKTLHGKSKIKDETEYLTKMSLPVDFKKSLFLVLLLPDWKWKETDKREEIIKTMDWLNTEMNEFSDNIGIWMNDENVFAYCLQNQEKTDWKDVHADLMILQKNYRHQCGRSVSVISRRNPVFIEEMSDCYQKELAIIPYRLFRGFNCFLTVEDIEAESDKTVDLMEIQNQINGWTKEICSGKEEVKDQYLELLRSLEKNWEIYHTVLFMIKTSLEQGKLIIQGNTESNNGLEESMHFEDCLIKEEIEEKITQVIDDLVKQKKDLSLNRQYEYVEKINEYIEQNYADVDFGIIQVAEEIGVSAAYLSKIYKQITNINIIDRITNRRMEAAADILKGWEIPTNVVYEKVGYASNNYFYRVFKKYYGVTPRLYREMDEEGRAALEARRKVMENETK